MTAPGIGAKLKNERIAKGVALADISRDTRIAPRFLEAIESEDFSSLPGLLFTRNFIRQYALALNLDPEPLLGGLPKPDETTAPLPDPPARPRTRSSYHRDRQMRALAITSRWLAGAAAAGAAAYMGIHQYSTPLVTSQTRPAVVQAAGPVRPGTFVAAAVSKPAAQTPAQKAVNQVSGSAGTGAVMVTLTAHARAWIKVDADGKTVYMGTLTPDETKEVSAHEQIELQTGNAGALSVSLNGKALESLGGTGQLREVRLTAEGPEFPRKDRPPQPSSGQL